MTDESQWVENLLRASAELDGQLRRAVEGLSDSQLNWRPDKDTWSVLQQLQHLNLANRPYLDSVRDLVESASEYREAYKASFWGKFLVYAVGPEERIPSPVPKPLIPSEEPLGREIVTEYFELQDRYHLALEKLRGKDLNGRFVSPFAKFMKLKIGDAIHITERHNARHLGKAIRLIQRSDFPQLGEA